MLSRPVSRAAHSPNPLTFSSGSIRPSASGPLLSASRPQHRRSSSKSSHPPGGNPPSARSSAQTESGSSGNGSSAVSRASGSASQDKRRSSTNGGPRQRSRTYTLGEELSQQNDAFSNVPAVQPTSHLNLADVKLSSLFALHRPISINPSAAYPPTTSNKSFNAIFSPPKQSKISPEIYTIAPSGSPNSVYQSEEADGLHFSVLQSSPSNAASSISTVNADEQPSLETLARQFRPFQKPPAPVPFRDQPQSGDQDTQRPSPDITAVQNSQDPIAEASFAPNTTSRTYMTTLTIKEATNRDGQMTYTASASPIVERRSSAPSIRRSKIQSTSARQPFLSRMSLRSGGINDKPRQHRMAAPSQPWIADTDIGAGELEMEAEGEGSMGDEAVDDLSREMLLISVKRQRKLKMKKHKYKKLMRRTRNLRRRQGRL